MSVFQLVGLAIVVVIGVPFVGAQDSVVPVSGGDHVAIVGNTYADQLRVHGYLETLLRLHAEGEDPIALRNFGWAGDTLTHRDRPDGFPSEVSSLEDFGTDVIIACFGMGESFGGEAGLSDFRSDVLDFLAAHDGKSFNGESPVRMVLVSPIGYEDLGDRTPHHERRNAELAAYSGVIAAVAAERMIPFVDLNRPSAELMEEEGAPDLTVNGITLNAYGYWALSTAAARDLVGSTGGWKLSINPRSGFMSEMVGIEAEPGDVIQNGFAFVVKELTPPFLAPPGGDPANLSLKDERDVLTVGGLEAGEYALLIDEEEIVIATADEWAAGVVLTGTPAHRALEEYRVAINDKNTQHTYAWKAYNQVHIVGERRSSPAGRALPAELIEFQKLTEEREVDLSAGIELATRTWTLIQQ